LADRYRLRHVLGRGGMATVYLAHDLRHQREVAVKVLRPDLALSLGAARFLTEIQIVARLTHPNILPLFDSGEVEGRRSKVGEDGEVGPSTYLYYTMPYVDGASLRQRIEPSRQMTRDDALAIASPVADALSYAHRMGIYHRDIKPENILFSQGHPVVADFGIAKALSTAGGANLTRTGFPLGTPGYMSPEQAAGMTDLDERSDVYSLAVVVYEMIVGEVPGRWPTEDAVRAGRFLEAPAAHRSRLAEAGSGFEGALVRGLAIRHDQRTPTPDQLVSELEGVTGQPRRRYAEGEVREIVRRATELEASNPTGGAMTIGGVEALAAEVGVTPELVREAAKSLRTPGGPAALSAPPAQRSSPWSPVIGGPTRLFYEREVEGELPDSEFPLLVEEIQRSLQQVGLVSQLGRSFSWTLSRSGSMRRDMEVAVSVRAGRTRIVVRENLGPLIGATFGVICGAVGGGGMGPILGATVGAFHLAPVSILGILPAWFATVFGIARVTYRKNVGRRQEDFQRLADRLAEMTEELIKERGVRVIGKR
jgi:serine/threonine protein kinase